MSNQSGEVKAIHFSVDGIGKLIGLFTAVAIGTGILSDLVFFYVFDYRLFQLMALSDHIESAAARVPVLIAFILTIASGVWVTHKYTGAPYRLWILPLFVWFAICIGVWIWTPSLWERWTSGFSVAPFVVLLMYAGVCIFAVPAGRLSNARLLTVTGVGWILMTILNSADEAWQATSPTRFDLRPPSQLTLTNDGSISGGIVRFLDRGVIILTEPGGSYLFVPREHVRRIETHPRTPPLGKSRGESGKSP